MLCTGGGVIAPDHAGRGTNALLLARPGLIRYCFGDNSCAAHQVAAVRASLSVTLVHRSGLARDMDNDCDLEWLAA